MGAKRGQRIEEQKRKQELNVQKELLEQKRELEQVQNKQVYVLLLYSLHVSSISTELLDL